jgi:hypothetical protein
MGIINIAARGHFPLCGYYLLHPIVARATELIFCGDILAHVRLEIRLQKDTVSLGEKIQKAGGNSCGARGMFLTRYNLHVDAPSHSTPLLHRNAFLHMKIPYFSGLLFRLFSYYLVQLVASSHRSIYVDNFFYC